MEDNNDSDSETESERGHVFIEHVPCTRETVGIPLSETNPHKNERNREVVEQRDETVPVPTRDDENLVPQDTREHEHENRNANAPTEDNSPNYRNETEPSPSRNEQPPPQNNDSQAVPVQDSEPHTNRANRTRYALRAQPSNREFKDFLLYELNRKPELIKILNANNCVSG